MKFYKSPVTRLSFGLMSLTISLLLMADFIGLAPRQQDIAFEARKNLCESLALQFSTEAGSGNLNSIRTTLKALVDRDNDILSAALRSSNGSLLAVAGDHLKQWHKAKDGRSTLTHIQVPIVQKKQLWGTVELRFTSLSDSGILGNFKRSFWSLILFVAVTGFIGYFFMMKRTLRELDPSSVIPARVTAAFDVLKEGVLILDKNEQVVMANWAFASHFLKKGNDLIGMKGSELGWLTDKKAKKEQQFPWLQVMANGQSQMGIEMHLEPWPEETIKFKANASPILDGNGQSRGTMVTFDNITELEEKNFLLKQAIANLKNSSHEITSKNKKLEFLANHDPMTKLLNRRSFNTQFAILFQAAMEQNLELSCIMCDIDHFKLVNDNYGHATGDEVIKAVAHVLSDKSRDNDLVGRYGGEEFCLIFSKLDIQQTAAIGERIRQTIAESTIDGINVTISLGVSSIKHNPQDPSDLTNQADRALYIAKESGRNRIVCWSGNKESTLASQQPAMITETEDCQTNMVDNVEVTQLRTRITELEELSEKRAQQLEHFNAYNAQTGLPTRDLFLDRINQALTRANRYHHVIAVLSVAIKDMSRIRDVLGHDTANQVLDSCGIRLAQGLRKNDTVAIMQTKKSMATVSHIGQDEFGVLLTDIQQVDQIPWIIKRIIEPLSQPFSIEAKEIHLQAHVGISLSDLDGENADDLVKAAGAASHQVEHMAGNAKYRFYSKDIDAAASRHLKIEGQLHQAISKEEFLLYYQAKVDAVSGVIVGVEALIRWDSPEMGLVPPNDFISIAENSGQINAIGDWVLKTACKQIREWNDIGITTNIAVNFSAKQFRVGNPVKRIQELLTQYKINTSSIEIEVTESAMMDDMDRTVQILQKISAMGIAIAIDDFGTGYSSLGYLKQLPGTYVKLDRSFIMDITRNNEDADLVLSIIKMAHVMGLKVVAEGVETKEQAEMLADFGCNEFQGYLFSKPLPAQQATHLLQTGVDQMLKRWAISEVA